MKLGMAFASCIAVVALLMEEFLPVAPVAVGLVLALLVANLPGTPRTMEAGVQWTSKWALFAAIVLLGFRIRWADLAAIGSDWFYLIPAIGIPLGLGWWFSRRGNDNWLLGIGTAICGVSAMAAARGNAKDEEFAASVATVTLLGTAGLLLYPFIAWGLAIPDHTYGMWAGLTLHAVPQAVGAGFAVSATAGGMATTFKLARVATLPLLVAMQRGRNKMPLEVLGFLAAVVVANLNVLPNGLVFTLAAAAKPLLVLAMVAIGLQTRFASMRLGQNLLVGAIIWVATSVTVLWMLS